MSSSICESDGSDAERGEREPPGAGETPGRKPSGRPPRRPRSPRRSPSERVLLWVPTLLLLLATLAVLLPWGRRQGGRPGPEAEPPERWFRVGRGETEFLGDAVEFLALRRASRDEAYRIEIDDGIAFESPRLDEVFQLFLQHRLAGLQPGEVLSFRFGLDPGVEAPRFHVPSTPLVWSIEIAEDPRDKELWYRAPHGRTGEMLYARGLEALKIRLAREIARDVKAVLGGELILR